MAIQGFGFSFFRCAGKAVRGWNWIAASAAPPRNDGVVGGAVGRCSRGVCGAKADARKVRRMFGDAWGWTVVIGYACVMTISRSRRRDPVSRSAIARKSSRRRTPVNPHVIARRRSRRGNPGVWLFVFSLCRKGSERVELDCRVGCASSLSRCEGVVCLSLFMTCLRAAACQRRDMISIKLPISRRGRRTCARSRNCRRCLAGCRW